LQRQRTASEQEMIAFAVIDQKVRGALQIRHKECVR
jgi:hypothetical protein